MTKETRIRVSVNLDGTGIYKVSTGVGFLDHMLEQLSRHSLIDLEVEAEGDLHIDFHHTTEDSGIAIGEAVAKALGDRRGIQRYGDALIPMDETLTRVAIDMSNRPYLIWKVQFTRDKLGDMDTELFKEWFQAFAQLGGLTLAPLGSAGDTYTVSRCYTPTAPDENQTDPGLAQYTDTVTASGYGKINEVPFDALPKSATCKLCPTCPSCDE